MSQVEALNIEQKQMHWRKRQDRRSPIGPETPRKMRESMEGKYSTTGPLRPISKSFTKLDKAGKNPRRRKNLEENGFATKTTQRPTRADGRAP